jgi:hypothetical protein
LFVDIITTDLGTDIWYLLKKYSRSLIADIAINTSIIYINKLNALILIYDTVIKNEKITISKQF